MNDDDDDDDDNDEVSRVFLSADSFLLQLMSHQHRKLILCNAYLCFVMLTVSGSISM